MLSGAPEAESQALRSFGYNVGMAFQIVDDVLDFTSSEEELGKPVGNDLLQGTLTLPALLFAAKLIPMRLVVRRLRDGSRDESDLVDDGRVRSQLLGDRRVVGATRGLPECGTRSSRHAAGRPRPAGRSMPWWTISPSAATDSPG